jgi:hypothetical protein
MDKTPESGLSPLQKSVLFWTVLIAVAALLWKLFE